MSYLNQMMSRKELTKEVEEKICALYKIDQNMFSTRSRRKEYSEARFAVWYLLHRFYSLGFDEIGRKYGYHGSTVSHGVERIQELGIDKQLVEALATGKALVSGDNVGIVCKK